MVNENSYIELTLTEQGAFVLNEFNKEMSERTGLALGEAYKDWDVYKCQIHEMLVIFGGSKHNICGPLKFRNIDILEK